MPTLRSPEGREYQSTDPVEVRNLIIGHGFTVVDSGESTQDTQTADQETDETDAEEAAPADG